MILSDTPAQRAAHVCRFWFLLSVECLLPTYCDLDLSSDSDLIDSSVEPLLSS